MTDSTILICWGGTYMACDTADFNNRRWSANTPEALIAKLDTDTPCFHLARSLG